MNRLRTFAKRVQETHGMNHQLMLQGLRQYIKETNTEQLEREIVELEDFNLLRALQEAGVPKRAFETYLKAVREVK